MCTVMFDFLSLLDTFCANKFVRGGGATDRLAMLNRARQDSGSAGAPKGPPE